jgi:tetratricopeptide (TPR) repeat protein/predicted Ser/Thr protein kinase
MDRDEKIAALLSVWERGSRSIRPEQLCAESPELLPDVVDRIRRLKSMDRLLDDPDERLKVRARAGLPAIPGYHVYRLLGEGGMGVVYKVRNLANGRIEALKLLHSRCLYSPRSRLRFEREVQLASRLEHPLIARVYASGEFSGTPYYTMEHVRGRRFGTYTGPRRPTDRAIVRVVAEVADAVSYAHQRGILHRDLTPANILVTPAHVPKILDFGLARDLQDSGDGPGLTLTRVQPGTPRYMSPEQSAGCDGIDVRSDVFSLGVVLYEQLTGRLPNPAASTGPAGGRRLVSTGDRELDAVLQHCLEPEPPDRYQSMAEFRDDLRAWLEQRPLRARPRTLRYLAGRWCRRNRRLAGAILAAGLGVAALAGWAIWNDFSHRRAMKTQLATMQAVDEYLLDRVLGGADPARAQGRNPTLRELLDEASAAIESALVGQPLVEADVRARLATPYLYLAQLESAERHARRCWSLRSEHLGPDHPRTMEAEAQVAFILASGQERFEEAERMERSLLRRRSDLLGENHPDTIETLHRIGDIAAVTGRLSEAAEIFENTLQRRLQTLGERHPATLWSMSDLGAVYKAIGRTEESQRLLDRAYELRRQVLGDLHPDTLNAELNLADLHSKLGRREESERLLDMNIDKRRRVLGESHRDVALPMILLAKQLAGTERRDEAVELARKAYQIRSAPFGIATRQGIHLLYNYLEILSAAGEQHEVRDRVAELRRLLNSSSGSVDPAWKESAMQLLSTFDQEPPRKLR